MTRRRLAIGFFVRVAALYVLAMAPWPGLESAYGKAFVKCADYLANGVWGGGGSGIFGSDALVRVYHQDPEEHGHRDLSMILVNRMRMADPDGGTHAQSTSRHLGYMPTAVLVSLVLATPLGWIRRAWSLLWGLLLINVFVVMRFGSVLLYKFHGEEPHCVYNLGTFGTWLVETTFVLLAVVPATAYVVPLFIWMAVMFRREDWDTLVKQFEPPAPKERRTG